LVDKLPKNAPVSIVTFSVRNDSYFNREWKGKCSTACSSSGSSSGHTKFAGAGTCRQGGVRINKRHLGSIFSFSTKRPTYLLCNQAQVHIW
jgi:hypothetical protein